MYWFEYRSVGTMRILMAASQVLVAEDNEVNRAVLVKQLEGLGCSAVAVESGEAAVEAATKDNFVVIMMNFQMGALSGVEATRQIRQSEKGKQSRSIIIGVTAKSIPQEREKGFDAGMDEILVRPFSLLDLKDVLSRWLDLKDMAGSLQTFDDLKAVIDPPLNQAFRKSIAGLMNRLFLAVHNQDNAEIKSATHEMKGLCLSCGYDELAGWCSQLEKALMVSDWVQVQATFNAMVDQYKDLL